MIRNAVRLLLAGFVAVALTLGMTGSGSAGAVTSGGTVGQADRSGSHTKAAAKCTKQKAKVAKAKKHLKKANAKVKKAKKAKHRADSAKQKRAANKKLAKAKRHQKHAKKALAKAKKQLRKCQQSGPGDGGGSGVVQQCLDAGLPAELCDAAGQIPDPTGGGGDPDVVQQCLDAGLPAELCGALSQLPAPPDPSNNPLCDLGLPLPICPARPVAPGSR